MERKRIIVALTGASGTIYFERTARALLAQGHHVDLIVSKYGRLTLKEETTYGEYDGEIEAWLRDTYGDQIAQGTLTHYNINDQTAPTASGSDVRDGMVVVPCTMKTSASIAHGLSSNLIERSADVMLKERRPLVVVPREAPFNLVHLRNLTALVEAGASVLPASPAFYQQPKTFADLGDFIAGRVLSLLGLPHELFPKWEGL